MFKELYELSQKVDETLPSVGYGNIVAHISIEIQSVVTISSSDFVKIDRKGKESLGQELLLPDFIRSSGDRPLPIADTASYVLGIGKGGAVRQQMYLELLQECYQDTKDEVIASVIEVVKSLNVDKVRSSCSPWFDLSSKTADEDPLEKARIVFNYGGKLISDRISVKKFWAEKYSQLSGASTEGKCCIV